MQESVRKVYMIFPKLSNSHTFSLRLVFLTMEYLTKLNDLKYRNSKIDTLVDLSTNTKGLFEIMDQHKKVSDDILDLLEVVCKKLENLEALAVYRDFISILVSEVKTRLDYKVWVAVKNAINRKRNYKKVNFRSFEKDNILKLEKVLSDVNISVKEFELLMALKNKGNCEFHKGEDQDAEEVKQQLETSLPSDLQEFKDPLRKLFCALDIWTS
jgi:hypothetical protein